VAPIEQGPRGIGDREGGKGHVQLLGEPPARHVVEQLRGGGRDRGVWEPRVIVQLHSLRRHVGALPAGRGQPLELLGIPERVQVLAHDHGHVPAHPLHLLQVPEREGVVVAIGEEDRVRLDAHQQIVRPIACGPVPRPARPAPVELERDDRQGEHRRGREPGARGTDRLRHSRPYPGQPEPPQHSPEREAPDEEVVALAHLVARGVGHLRGEQVAILEVQVEDEPEREPRARVPR